MWELYDELIEGIPDGPVVDLVLCGCQWTAVRSGDNVGTALTIKNHSRPSMWEGDFLGAPLKEVAACVKSWDFTEATIGLAAINAYYNSREQAKKNGLQLSEEAGHRSKRNAFASLQDRIKGKNVCVVGHFPNLERDVAPYCSLSILERNPQDGDYPDSAAEYILPEQDYVFITGCTFSNKTLPRLLELSQNAYVSLVGPSVVLTPSLFHYGVDNLSGFIVTDPDLCINKVMGGRTKPIFDSGRLAQLYK